MEPEVKFYCLNCKRPIPPNLKASKFCSPQCKIWYEAEKDYETEKAIESFRKQDEQKGR